MQHKNFILIAFLVIKFVVQYYAIDSVYELHRDEYLHLDLGNHLAFGYTSVPPITGLISFVLKYLGGQLF